MGKSFEDEFMELQSEFIALGLEVAERQVEKVYAYASIESKSKMFNAFFKIDGEITTLNQLGISNKLMMQFLKLGTADLDKILVLCNKYNMPVPTEIKMYFDVKTSKYRADYKYDEICSANMGKSAGQVFMEWIEEIKNEISM